MPDNIMLENEPVDAKRQVAVYQRFEHHSSRRGPASPPARSGTVSSWRGNQAPSIPTFARPCSRPSGGGN